MIDTVRLLIGVMIPLAPVWSTVINTMIATRNSAHISVSASLLVICTMIAVVPRRWHVALKAPMVADVR